MIGQTTEEIKMETWKKEQMDRMENQQDALFTLLRSVLQETRERAATIKNIDFKAIVMAILAETSGQAIDIENARLARLAASEGKNPSIQKQVLYDIDRLHSESARIREHFKQYRLAFWLKRDLLSIATQIEKARQRASESTDGLRRVTALIDIAKLSWEPVDFEKAHREALEIMDPDKQALALAALVEGLRDLNCGELERSFGGGE
jgi:hypothetical protein